MVSYSFLSEASSYFYLGSESYDSLLSTWSTWRCGYIIISHLDRNAWGLVLRRIDARRILVRVPSLVFPRLTWLTSQWEISDLPLLNIPPFIKITSNVLELSYYPNHRQKPESFFQILSDFLPLIPFRSDVRNHEILYLVIFPHPDLIDSKSILSLIKYVARIRCIQYIKLFWILLTGRANPVRVYFFLSAVLQTFTYQIVK